MSGSSQNSMGVGEVVYDGQILDDDGLGHLPVIDLVCGGSLASPREEPPLLVDAGQADGAESFALVQPKVVKQWPGRSVAGEHRASNGPNVMVVAVAEKRKVSQEVSDIHLGWAGGGVVEVDESDGVADDDLFLVEVAVHHG